MVLLLHHYVTNGPSETLEGLPAIFKKEAFTSYKSDAHSNFYTAVVLRLQAMLGYSGDSLVPKTC